MAFSSAQQHRVLVFLLLLPTVFITVFAKSKLRVGEIMTPLSTPLKVSSPYNVRYRFKIQSDCNAVLRADGEKIWESNTTRPWGQHCIMELQRDGQLTIYSDWGAGKAVWTSGNKDKVSDKHVFEIQTDGNGVIYNTKRKPIWATQTNRYRYPKKQKNPKDKNDLR